MTTTQPWLAFRARYLGIKNALVIARLLHRDAWTAGGAGRHFGLGKLALWE